MTPKESNGRLDLTFKIVWIQGTLAEVTATSARIQDCLGLVRGKQSFGLRFRADKFDSAWVQVFPGTTPPTKSQGDLLFKVSGLPFGCTSEVVERWGKTLSWEIFAIKALGPQAWLVRSSSHPKDGIIMFNTTPVLVQFLPPREKSSGAVVVGPRARSSAVDSLTVHDPWANWTGPRQVAPPSTAAAAAQPRQVAGPIEDRFKAQDETISSLRMELQDLANKQDEQSKLTEHRFQQAEIREKKNVSQMQSDMKAMQKDLESSFQASLTQNASSLDARLRELKDLLSVQSASKRKSPAKEDDPMEWLWLLERKALELVNFVMPWSQCEHCFGRFQHISILAFATFCCLFLIIIMGVLGFVSHPMMSCATFCAHPFRLQIHRSMVSSLAMRQCMSNVTPFVSSWTSFVVSNLSCPYARGPFLGCAFRWGEALHPGPQYRFAITNPTSVVSKIDHYTNLVQTYDLQAVVAAETSATGIAQRVFRQKLKTLSMRSCWSVPVPDQFCTLSGAASLRGKAMGVAAFSKQPIRDAISTLPPDVVALSRISHHIVTLGTMQVQLLVVYGFPGTYPDSHGLNSQLLTNALEAIDQISLPAIIAGDFNCDPFELSIASELQIRGFQDLKALHHRIYGTAMAFTCRQATHPDNALICPELAATVRQVVVHEEPLFDTHCPVIFELDIKHQQQFRSGLNLPKSWISLSFDDSYWIRSYSDVRRLHGAPSDLPEWGVLVEHAADRVFRATQSQHHDIPAQHTSGLPGAYRGRCQPRQVKSFPIRSLTKLGRPGDFQPQFEVRSFATMKQITQLRRIRSLKRQLCRLQGCPIDHRRERELHKEWTSILKQRNFAHWCNQTPEIGPPPQGLPSMDFLNDVDQIMTLETNHRVYSEANTAKAKSTRQLDRKFHGRSQAFAVLRDTPSNYVDSLTVDIEEQGVVVSDPTDDTWEIFVDRSSEFNLVDCVQVNSLPCRIVDVNSDSIVVKRNPHLQLTSEEVSLCQTQTVVDKGRIFELLTQFWQLFWQSTSAVSSEDSHSFESFLQMLPSDLPEISVTVDDLSLWKSAIHDSKAHSARGVDAISAAEMKVLPDAAVVDLITLITTVYHKGWKSRGLTCTRPNPAHLCALTDLPHLG